MSQLDIRYARPEEKPQLAALWQTAFGDDQDYIRRFFTLFLRPDTCIAAVQDGKVVSAMYLMDGPLLFPPSGKSLSTTYTYALATDPAWRGRGIGTAVYRACARAALERTDAACVLPAEQELYAFYERAVPSVPVSFVRQATLSREEVPAGDPAAAAPISVGEYYLRRKAILRGQPYALMPRDFFSMELYQMQRFGGAFLSVDGDIAVVEHSGDTCRVLELLAPESDWPDVLAAVAARFPAARYELRTPLFFPGPGQERPFMLAVTRPDAPLPSLPTLWWGFAFD